MSRLSRTEYLAAWGISLGIMMVLLGIHGIRYLPMTPEEEQAEAELQIHIAHWKQLASEVPSIRELLEPEMARLHQRSIRARKDPPYLVLGRWGLGIGIALIGMGVLASRFRPTEGRWVRSNEDV